MQSNTGKPVTNSVHRFAEILLFKKLDANKIPRF